MDHDKTSYYYECPLYGTKYFPILSCVVGQSEENNFLENEENELPHGSRENKLHKSPSKFIVSSPPTKHL